MSEDLKPLEDGQGQPPADTLHEAGSIPANEDLGEVGVASESQGEGQSATATSTEEDKPIPDTVIQNPVKAEAVGHADKESVDEYFDAKKEYSAIPFPETSPPHRPPDETQAANQAGEDYEFEEIARSEGRTVEEIKELYAHNVRAFMAYGGSIIANIEKYNVSLTPTQEAFKLASKFAEEFIGPGKPFIHGVSISADRGVAEVRITSPKSRNIDEIFILNPLDNSRSTYSHGRHKITGEESNRKEVDGWIGMIRTKTVTELERQVGEEDVANLRQLLDGYAEKSKAS
ncbi:MAG TPA: hypothetical protein VMR34_01825 [Candidatus Saccharimonadales bacterium]|nr:hypothetical protein [Candidatus Saccharimonadales bacterium]